MTLKDIQDPRLRELVDELCVKIQAHYPEALFRIYPPDGDPKSITVDAYTFEEDSFNVLDLVSQRAVDILVDEDYYIGINPLPLLPTRGPKDPAPPSGWGQFSFVPTLCVGTKENQNRGQVESPGGYQT